MNSNSDFPNFHDPGNSFTAHHGALPPMTSMAYPEGSFGLPDPDELRFNEGHAEGAASEHGREHMMSITESTTLALGSEFENLMVSRGQQENSCDLPHDPTATGGATPQPIPDEVYPAFIDPGVTRPKEMVIRYGTNEPVETMVDVVRRDAPSQTYMRIDSFKPIPLRHGNGPDWGKLYLGYILPRVDTGSVTGPAVFREPSEDEAQRVAIKRLVKSVLAACQNEAEDPEKEIFRMKTIGDSYHVLECVEALEDDRYLYIISPFAEEQTLVEKIIQPETTARIIFRQLLEDLHYLHKKHRICHRDISPGNCLVHKGRILLNDLAMSHLIPLNSGGWVHPFGRWGKPPYWTPESFIARQPVHAESSDVWAAVIVLFNLLTGCNLYELPHVEDRVFRFFIFCGGFSPERNPLAQRAWEELQDMEERRNLLLVVQILQRIQNLSMEVRELFYMVLRVNPHERWNLEQILSCRWMTQQ